MSSIPEKFTISGARKRLVELKGKIECDKNSDRVRLAAIKKGLLDIKLRLGTIEKAG